MPSFDIKSLFWDHVSCRASGKWAYEENLQKNVPIFLFLFNIPLLNVKISRAFCLSMFEHFVGLALKGLSSDEKPLSSLIKKTLCTWNFLDHCREMSNNYAPCFNRTSLLLKTSLLLTIKNIHVLFSPTFFCIDVWSWVFNRK